MADLGFGFEVRLKDSFSRTAKKVSGLSGKMSRGFKGVSRSIRGISASIPGLAKGFGLAGAAYVGVIQPLKEYGSLQEELAKVQALLWDPSRPEESLRAVARIAEKSRELALKTGIDRVKIVSSTWDMISATVDPFMSDFTDVMETLTKQTRATQAEQKTLVDFTTLAWVNFGKEIGTAEQLTSKLFAAQKVAKGTMEQLSFSVKQAIPFAAEMNFTFDETVAALTALTHVAPSAEIAGTQLKNVMKQLMMPALQVQRRFEELELDMSKTAIQSRGLVGTLNMLKKVAIENTFDKAGLKLHSLGLKFPAVAFKGRNMAKAAAIITNELQKLKPDQFDKVKASFDRLGVSLNQNQWEAKTLEERFRVILLALKRGGAGMSQFFPDIRALAAAVGLTGKAADVFVAAMKQMGVSTEVTEAAFKTMMDTPMAKMQRFRERLRDVQLKIGEKLLKPGGVADRFLGWAEGADFSGMIEKVFGLVSKIGALIDWAYHKFTGPGIVQTFLKGIKSRGDKLVDNVRSAFDLGAPKEKSSTGRLLTGGAGMAGALAGAVKGFMAGAKFGWPGMIAGTVGGAIVGEKLGGIIPAVETTVAEQIRGAFPKQIAMIRAMIGLGNLDRLLGVAPPKLSVRDSGIGPLPTTTVERRPALLGDFGEEIRREREAAAAREDDRFRIFDDNLQGLIRQLRRIADNPPPVRVMAPNGKVLFETVAAEAELQGSRG